MKRKIVAILTALALCAAFSFNVFAQTSYGSGYTAGPQRVRASAWVDASIHSASAYTYYNDSDAYDAEDDFHYFTALTYYYEVNGAQYTQDTRDNHESPRTFSLGIANGNGTKATSSHGAYGGPQYGNWSCDLTAYVL